MLPLDAVIMRAFVLAGLVGLVVPTFRASGQVQSPAERAQLVEAVRQQEQQAAVEGERVARAAPYIFIGRPLTGGTRLDRMGRWHHTTVVQVLEVLRGAPQLAPGTEALTDTMGPTGPRPLGRPPTAAEIRGGDGRERYADGAWEVYFCRPAALPGPLAPYRTDNRLVLRHYATESRVGGSQAMVMHLDGCRQEMVVSGQGQHFAAEADVWDYLQRVAHVTPRRTAVLAYPLPALLAEDIRGHDYRTQPVRGQPAR